MTTYNHAYDFSFDVSGSESETGHDVSPFMIRSAIINRAMNISDDELMQSIDLFDTQEDPA